MFEELSAMADRAAGLGRGFEPARVTGEDAEAIADAARAIVRAAGSIEARAAARAAEANAWQRAGCQSPEEWLAKKAGSSKARAKKTLELGERLERHEETRERYTSGGLSQDQAEIVSGAADENPDAEADLLDTAETETLATLRQEAAKAKAAVSDEEARQAKIHGERYASGGSDEEGAYRLGSRMSAFQGGIFDTHWQRFRDLVARDAKKKGERLTAGQIGADALVLMAQTAAENQDPDRPGTDLALPDVRLHLLIDQQAWERGRTEAGETCEIDGVGPVTVAQARQLVEQGAFVTARGRREAAAECEHWALFAEVGCSRQRWSITQGLPAEQREHPTSPPGRIASRAGPNAHTSSPPGCDHRWRLQRDHKTVVALGGRTTYHQLQRLCWGHHDAKTRDDMRKIRAREQRTRAGPVP